MNSETRVCQNCKKDFTIEPEDFNFYEKIKVPAPTFCPECRMIRRMVWRNVRSLYKRSCGLCDKTLISMYSDVDTALVYCTDCFFGDKCNPLEYGKEYDFSKPFFLQLNELLKIVPRFYSYKFGRLINSDYTNYSIDNKNAYLSYSVLYCEDILYSENIDNSRNSLDCYSVNKVDGCSYNVDCENNYNTQHAIKSKSCIDSYFLFDCVNCQDCCLSYNLRNQQYCYKNQKLSKEEYEDKIRTLELETYSGLEKTREEFDGLILKSIYRYAFIHTAQNTTGDYIHNSKNTKQSFDGYDTENISYCVRSFKTKDSMDTHGSAINAQLIYESLAATGDSFKDSFCYLSIEGCRECEYSLILKNCSNCFGCISLTNAKYCILNKQYKEEEYFEMIKKIKEQMNTMPYIDEMGRIFKYGEFFPYDLSPFGYNETCANDYFPITKEKATEKGYKWKEREKRDYKITKEVGELPDSILEVKDEILNEIISCPNKGNQMYQCTTAFKIVSNELQFYRQKNLPLPRYCPNCRHYQRLKYRNPMRLYTRNCMHEGCGNTFQTTYASERPEIVYCERCYQQEVY